MVELAILIISTTLLAYLGAGVFPYVMPVLATVLSLIGCFLLGFKKGLQVPLYALFSVLLIVFIFATFLPLPVNSSIIFGKKRSQQNQLVHSAIQDCKEIGLIESSGTAFSLSRNRAGTARALTLWLAGIWIAVIASRLDDKRRKQYLIFAVTLAGVIACLGFIGQWVFHQGKTLWWVFPAGHGEPVACFINRNHFAGFLAILCPASICLSAEYISKRRYFAALCWTGVFGILAVAILMSMSRGAWISSAASLLITAFVLAFKYENRTRLILAAILFVFLTAGLSIPSAELKDRAESMQNPIETSSANMRFNAWRDAFGVSSDYTFIGTGANGFRMVFPQHRTDTLRKEFKHVENEYIQTFVEYGLIGSILVLLTLISLFSPVIKKLASVEKLNTVQISALAGCIAAASHACIDFALRIPIYFLVFIPLLIFASASGEYRKRFLLPLYAWIPGVVSLAILILICTTSYHSPERDMPDHIKNADAEELAKCLQYSPTSWHTWFHMGTKSMLSRKPRSYELGEKFLVQAMTYDPNNYILAEQLCRVRLQMDDMNGALEMYKRLKELRSWKKIPELDKIIAEQKKQE